MRLIDAEIAYDKIAEQETSYYMDMEGVQAGLDETPTVDAVRVVRCGECVHNCGRMDGYICCDKTRKISIWHSEDWYCADGERKDDGND